MDLYSEVVFSRGIKVRCLDVLVGRSVMFIIIDMP